MPYPIPAGGHSDRKEKGIRPYVIRQLNTQNRFVGKRCHIGFYKTVQKGCTDIKQKEGNLGLFARVGNETPDRTSGSPGFSVDLVMAVHSGGLQ